MARAQGAEWDERKAALDRGTMHCALLLRIMKIHEYQGKEILAKFGVPLPRGMDIEGVAHDTPEKIHTEFVDPALGAWAHGSSRATRWT